MDPVTESLTLVAGADEDDVLDALSRIDPTGPVAAQLAALGVGDRLVLAPSLLDRRSGALSLGLVWRVRDLGLARRMDPAEFESFDRSGHVKIRWDLTLARGFLTVRTTFLRTDDAARTALLDRWTVVRGFAAGVVRRTALTVSSLAEDQPSKRRSTMQALWPPKPNEFETATRTSASRASFGM
jgi:hypothetical protein